MADRWVDSNAHVYINQIGIQLPGLLNETMWHDELHHCIISLSSIDLHASGAPESNKLALFLWWLPHGTHDQRDVVCDSACQGPYGEYPPGTSLLNAKLSIDKQFLAVQRTDMEVELLDLLLSGSHLHRYGVMCKRSSRILGFFWSTKVCPSFLVQLTYMFTANCRPQTRLAIPCPSHDGRHRIFQSHAVQSTSSFVSSCLILLGSANSTDFSSTPSTAFGTILSPTCWSSTPAAKALNFAHTSFKAGRSPSAPKQSWPHACVPRTSFWPTSTATCTSFTLHRRSCCSTASSPAWTLSACERCVWAFLKTCSFQRSTTCLSSTAPPTRCRVSTTLRCRMQIRSCHRCR